MSVQHQCSTHPPPLENKQEHLTKEMEQSTQVEHLGSPKAGISKPSHHHRSECTGPHKAQVNGSSLVVIIAQLHSTEQDHVTHNPKEGEPLKQLHQQDEDDDLELFAGLLGMFLRQPPARARGHGGPTQLVVPPFHGGPTQLMVVPPLFRQPLEVHCHHTACLVIWLPGWLNVSREYNNRERTLGRSAFLLRRGVTVESRAGIIHLSVSGSGTGMGVSVIKVSALGAL